MVAEVRPPGGETVTPQGVGVKRHLLQGGQGGEEVSREEAELVTVEEESPEGGQVTGGGGGRGGDRNRQNLDLHHRRRTVCSCARQTVETHLKACGSM